MNIVKTNIRKDIYVLEFATQKELTSTFLRFQEFYESPKFQGKVFTLEEYKKWYTSVKGSFSYYTDWSGFNIPSKILTSFYRGDFDPLRDEEKQFLDLFRDIKIDFYVIGHYKNYPEEKKADLLKHETAHALFSLYPEYREKVQEIIGAYDTLEFQNMLRRTGGYADNVLIDEVHAYTLSGATKLKGDSNLNMKMLLENLFRQYNLSK